MQGGRGLGLVEVCMTSTFAEHIFPMLGRMLVRLPWL